MASMAASKHFFTIVFLLQAVSSLQQNVCLMTASDDFSVGPCGYNSYCTAVNGPANCTCAPGYSLIDQSNSTGGCKPNYPQGCGIDDATGDLEELCEWARLENINWPQGDYAKLQVSTEEQCKVLCLNDHLCTVAIYDGNVTCWKKRLPLANGRTEETVTAISLIKVRKGISELTYKEKNKSLPIGFLGSSLTLNALFFISLILLVISLKNNRKSNKFSQVSALLETRTNIFSYKELEEATENFSEQLGRGSSAVVYKGILKLGPNHTHTVAVKKLDKLSHEADKEFKTELGAIGKTCHKNLVRLIGFCEEGSHRILVYEYMTNGSLAGLLLGESKPGWNIRAKIGLEIARGLVYLHDECEVPIIHCDIKPENILLDEFFTAKISDFGLVKLLQSNQSRTLTNIRGTRGYVAPEWFRSGAVTAKVDVYSFGVVLLEIICCRKNVPKLQDDNEEILTDWIWDCFVNGRLDAVVGFDKEAMADKERITSWVRIALWCTQEDPSKRPSMKMVLQMLEGFVEVLVPPMESFSMNS